MNGVTNHDVKFLDISSGESLNNDALEKIILNHPDLESIFLANCPNITDEAFSQLHSLEKLESFKIHNCSGVTDWFVQRIPSTIKVVEIVNCRNVFGCTDYVFENRTDVKYHRFNEEKEDFS